MHTINSFFRVGTPANIPMLIWRVGTHHKEIGTRVQLAISGAGRQDDNVTGEHFELVSIRRRLATTLRL